jgi:hypothetical protein
MPARTIGRGILIVKVRLYVVVIERAIGQREKPTGDDVDAVRPNLESRSL